MIPALIIGALALAAMAFVVLPIGRRTATFSDTDDASETDERKRIALTGILDLEEERDGGKLSPTEFESLRVRYERDAIDAIRAADGSSSNTDLEARLEDEIAKARNQLRCTTCGAPRVADAARCPSCGSQY